MRIISQDKMTDTPYDGAVVYIHRRTNKQIYVGSVADAIMDALSRACDAVARPVTEAEEGSTIREKMEEVSRND